MNAAECPESMKDKIVDFDGLNLDLSRFAHDACTLDMFTFLLMENREVSPEEVMLSATADTGMTLWIDGNLVMNHHSRLKMLPSFYRAEGGAAFAYPPPLRRMQTAPCPSLLLPASDAVLHHVREHEK